MFTSTVYLQQHIIHCINVSCMISAGMLKLALTKHAMSITLMVLLMHCTIGLGFLLLLYTWIKLCEYFILHSIILLRKYHATTTSGVDSLTSLFYLHSMSVLYW